MKKFFAFAVISAILLACFNVGAYEIVTDTYTDKGYISSSFLKQGREADRAVRYSPWLVNYALQTEIESQAVKGGEGFQQISDIAISPFDSNLMLFGTDTCGIWRSTDGGQEWINVNDGVNCWGVHDIIFHPTDRNVAYMIQGGPNSSTATMQIQSRTSYDGLYKTTDGGKTWKQILHIMVRGSLSTNRLLAFDKDKNIYLLSAEGLLKSEDEGTTWNYVYSFAETLERSDMLNYDLCISGDTILFTNIEYGVFASFDRGKTWTKRNIEGNEKAAAYGIDIDPENQDSWLCCFGENYRDVYRTEDAGITWEALKCGASSDPESDKYPIKVVFGKQAEDGTRGIYMLFRRVYTPLRVSFDDGKTWTVPTYKSIYGEEYRPLYGNAINTDMSNKGLIWYGVGTVLKSEDSGVSFVARNTPGYSGAYVEEIVFADTGRMYLSVTDHGFYRADSLYSADSYTIFTHEREQNHGRVGDIAVDPNDENHVIYNNCEARGFSLSQSFDGGVTWSTVAGTESSDAAQFKKFHNTNSNIIYTSFFTSYDGGKTWQSNTQQICAVSNNNDIVYAVSGNVLYKSTDCGVNFTELYTAQWPITYVLADNIDENVVYLGIINGNVIKLENDVAEIFDSQNNLDNVSPQAMAQNPENPKHIVLGGQCVDFSRTNNAYYVNYNKPYGIYETYDGGESWHIVKGMPSMRVVRSLEFTPDAEEILIGGFTGGLLVYDYEAYKKYLNAENSLDESFSVVYNGALRRVTVSGKINSESRENVYSTLLVLPASVMPKNAKISDIACIGQVPIDEDGEFEYSFTMPRSFQYGEYSVYLGGSNIYLPGVGNFDSSDFGVISFEFENTQDITVVTKINNTTRQDKKIAMYIIQYTNDEENFSKIIDIKAQSYIIESGSDSPITKKAQAPLDEKTDFYRAFLWMDDGSVKPLTTLIESRKKRN